ncbi:MAG: DNA polymerase III subunit alpha, partial [Candidatus Omnitrophota bacterium]|nr:DNA polymerase III subunit alpha [Candidatus Omnitrophota bacterium]
MFGAIEFYETAVKYGIKPIIGSEVYIAPDSRFEKSSHGIQEASFHLILLAKNEAGYKNLIKLVSLGFLEGFYYRPRIDKELLVKYKDGLVCTSSCLKGEIPHLILTNQLDQAKRVIDEYKNIFGKENFYLEVQDNLIPEQDKVNQGLIRLSKDMGVGLVATNDVHYLEKEHSKAHEVLLCIQTQTTIDDPNRMRFQTDEFYFKSKEEMSRAFGDSAPEAIKNTLAIAEMCKLELDFKTINMPDYKAPEGKTKDAFLRELVYSGLKTRYADLDKTTSDRVEYELKVIEKSGYISYFLIVWDFVHYAKENSIPVGPGRGSAAGSVVSYALGITDIDPLKYDLLFERFLNPERISMPDIDIDFCYERRAEVIDYVVKKYSKDNVAQIITFGTMLAKAVIRDVGRALGIAYGDVDKIAKLVPNDLNITLEHALEQEPELMNLYRQDPKIAQLIDTSKILEGLTRHASTHAAGVVISEKPLIERVPL